MGQIRYKMFHKPSGKIQTERIVTGDTYLTFGGSELLAYHSFCWKTPKPIPSTEKFEKVAGSVFC